MVGKGEFGGQDWGDIFIYLFYIWKQSLPSYKCELWHLKLLHKKILTLRKANCTTITVVKFDAVINASNYPPLLNPVKDLFVSMLVLTELISVLVSAELQISVSLNIGTVDQQSQVCSEKS